MRTFLALEIDDRIKEKIIEIQEKIKQTGSLTGSWVQKENLHLTLKFIGNTQLEYIDRIKNKIGECIGAERAMICTLNHIGTFPNEKFTRVIWAGIEGENVKIMNLAKRLEDSISLLGFEKEKREFKTHITICRPKQILNRDKFSSVLAEINKSFKPIEFTIDKIIFYESKLTPKGPIYSAIYEYNLP